MVRIPMQTLGVGGKSDKTCKQGLVPSYKDILLNWNSPANILSLAQVAQCLKVVFNSKDGNGFPVHTAIVMIFFIQHESGLYYFDVRKKTGWSILNIVQKKTFPYSVR